MNALLKRIQGKYPISIIGFPCNQFAYQEPADNKTELLNGLEYVRPGSGFKPIFHLMEKVEVNGKKESKAYTFLKKSCTTPAKGVYAPRFISNDVITPRDIVWNFEKFIIDKFGRPRYRFLSKVEPEDLEDILKALTTERESGMIAPSKMATIKKVLNKIERKYTT